MGEEYSFPGLETKSQQSNVSFVSDTMGGTIGPQVMLEANMTELPEDQIQECPGSEPLDLLSPDTSSYICRNCNCPILATTSPTECGCCGKLVPGKELLSEEIKNLLAEDHYGCKMCGMYRAGTTVVAFGEPVEVCEERGVEHGWHANPVSQEDAIKGIRTYVRIPNSECCRKDILCKMFQRTDQPWGHLQCVSCGNRRKTCQACRFLFSASIGGRFCGACKAETERSRELDRSKFRKLFGR
jgi:hypothetical protein